MSEYTKGEWEIKEETDGHFGVYPQDAESCIAVVWSGENQAEANARRICQCVNGFDKLLEVCKNATTAYDYAICREPTGEFRNKLTERNILRLQAIAEAEKEGGE